MKKLNDYFELVHRFPLRPIRSERELDRAIAVIDDLTTREKRSREVDDYLDVLSDLVENYERDHHPIPAVGPVEMLAFLMDDRSLSQRAVALGTGIAASTMSEILAGRREMNLEHIQKVAHFFGVSAAYFLRKTDTPHTAKIGGNAARTDEVIAKRGRLLEKQSK
jgi:HTH-type transcriptional regulator / antitoxin HigA